MKKFILIVSAVYLPEPVVSARLSEDLYHVLKDKGYEVKVLHPKPTRPYGFNFNGGNTIGPDEIITDSYTCPKSLLFGRIRESISFGKECAKYIINHHHDIRLVYLGLWPLFGPYFAIKACLKHNIPVITPVQDVYPESLSNKLPNLIGKAVNRLFLPLDQFVLKNSVRIHVISEKMRDYLSETRCIPKNRFVVIMNWQDEKDFLAYEKKSESIVQNELFTFMYMGNIGPVAGVDLLIEAFVKAEIKGSRLVIAGSGSMKQSLMEKAARYNDIEFWDVPFGKVPDIQAKADVMMLPIKKGAASSSIPSKLPAYMFSAKPIIGCVDGDSDTATAIKEADCGWVIKPENVEMLVETMKMVASLDNDTLKEKGEKAQSYGLSHFSKKENLSRLVKVIEELL